MKRLDKIPKNAIVMGHDENGELYGARFLRLDSI